MPKFEISGGLPATSSGLPDRDAALVNPIYQSINSLAQHLSMQTGNVQFTQAELAGINQLIGLSSNKYQKVFAQAAVDIGFGRLVNLSISGGKITANLANATTPLRAAHGICNAPSGLTAGQFGEIILMSGHCRGVANTEFGAPYYLAVDGLMTLTVPTATGVINQVVGIGLGSEGFYLDIEIAANRPVAIFRLNSTTLRVNNADGTHLDF